MDYFFNKENNILESHEINKSISKPTKKLLTSVSLVFGLEFRTKTGSATIL